MNLLETVKTGISSILTHRLRSTLTIVGVMIGITAVTLTVGLGQGAQGQVASEISSLGTNLLTVTPGSSTSAGGIRGGFGSASTLTLSDANALSNPIVAPDIQSVAATSTKNGTLVAGHNNWTTSVVGTFPTWLGIRDRSITQGRFLSQSDISNQTNVVVLGSVTAAELFGGRDPVGLSVNIDGVPMTVIGVLNTVGSSGSASATASLDDQAVVPFSTLANELIGGTNRDSVSSILIEARSSTSLSAAYQEANSELLALHGITLAADADFSIQSQQSVLSTATSVDKTLTILLGGVAAISLLVGGIGVMNIMLVSVTERIREIGLRKALGATPRVIRRQFLIEASILGLVGGLIGVVLGIVGAVVLPHFIANPIKISVPAMVAALIVAIGIGVGFGVYPAGRAANLPPIEALRSE